LVKLGGGVTVPVELEAVDELPKLPGGA